MADLCCKGNKILVCIEIVTFTKETLSTGGTKRAKKFRKFVNLTVANILGIVGYFLVFSPTLFDILGQPPFIYKELLHSWIIHSFTFFQDCISEALLARLFDPVISPRCYAIIAIKK